MAFIAVAVSIAENRHNGGRGNRRCAGSRTSAILPGSGRQSTHPVDADRSRGCSRTLSTGTQALILADLEWQND